MAKRGERMVYEYSWISWWYTFKKKLHMLYMRFRMPQVSPLMLCKFCPWPPSNQPAPSMCWLRQRSSWVSLSFSLSQLRSWWNLAISAKSAVEVGHGDHILIICSLIFNDLYTFFSEPESGSSIHRCPQWPFHHWWSLARCQSSLHWPAMTPPSTGHWPEALLQ